jgi:hypothetical protein
MRANWPNSCERCQDFLMNCHLVIRPTPIKNSRGPNRRAKKSIRQKDKGRRRGKAENGKLTVDSIGQEERTESELERLQRTKGGPEDGASADQIRGRGFPRRKPMSDAGSVPSSLPVASPAFGSPRPLFDPALPAARSRLVSVCLRHAAVIKGTKTICRVLRFVAGTAPNAYCRSLGTVREASEARSPVTAGSRVRGWGSQVSG